MSTTVVPASSSTNGNASEATTPPQSVRVSPPGSTVGPPNDDKRSVKFFVGSLDPDAWEDDVRLCFSKYGTVLDVSIPRHREHPERHRGFAFVTMMTKEEKHLVVQHKGHKHTIGKKDVEIKDFEEDTCEQKIFVGGISLDMPDEVIVSYFSRFGMVKNFTRRRRTEVMKWGILTFMDAHSREKAMAQKTHEINNEKVDVRFFVKFGHFGGPPKQSHQPRAMAYSAPSPAAPTPVLTNFIPNSTPTYGGYTAQAMAFSPPPPQMVSHMAAYAPARTQHMTGTADPYYGQSNAASYGGGSYGNAAAYTGAAYGSNPYGPSYASYAGFGGQSAQQQAQVQASVGNYQYSAAPSNYSAQIAANPTYKSNSRAEPYSGM